MIHVRYLFLCLLSTSSLSNAATQTLAPALIPATGYTSDNTLEDASALTPSNDAETISTSRELLSEPKTETKNLVLKYGLDMFAFVACGLIVFAAVDAYFKPALRN